MPSAAHIIFNEKGLPRSVDFDDKYFCEDDGYGEALAVFCGGNDLGQRFAAVKAGETFTIAETGFGTGLNFIAAWQTFQKFAPPNANLHFVSLDKFPLSAADLKKSLSVWPQIAEEVAELAPAYSALGKTGGDVTLANGRVRLTLFFADVLDALAHMARLNIKADAWFLDGFGPAKNPQMWSPEVFKRAADLSKAGTTAATFTVAGHVRRGLADAGFTVTKAPGFGRKRQMLKGEILKFQET